MYETSYTFKIYPGSFTSKAMEAIKHLSGLQNFQGLLRWISWEEDMKVVSSQFPNLLMSVFGRGEDECDMWRKDYLNGVEAGSWELDIPEADEKFITYVHYLNHLDK